MNSACWLGSRLIWTLGVLLFVGCGHHPVAKISPQLRAPSHFSPQRKTLSEAALQQATPPGFLSQQLPNGMRVSILPDPLSPSVAMRMFYQVGIANQPKDAPELAHLIEHLLFNPQLAPADANGKRTRVLDLLRQNDSQVSALTQAELTSYHTEVPKGFFDQALVIEAQRMTSVKFSASDLKAQIQSVEEEYRARFALGPGLDTAFDFLHRLLANHPYGNYFTPHRNLNQLTVAQVTAFYKQHYQPANAHLVIVGAVDPQAALSRVQALFGAIPSTPHEETAVPLLGESALPKDAEFSLSYPVKVAMSLYPLPSADHADNDALSVLANMLCRKWSLSMCLDDRNPLFTDLVKKQHSALVAGFGYIGIYDWGSTKSELGIVPFRAGGVWAFFAVYLPHRTKRTAFAMLGEQLRDLDRFDWLTEDALRRAKHVLRKRIYEESYTPTNRAEAIGKSEHLLHDPRYAFVRAQALEAITQADVKRVFLRYLRRQEPVSLYVVPESVPAWLRAGSWLYPALFRFIKHPLISHE